MEEEKKELEQLSGKEAYEQKKSERGGYAQKSERRETIKRWGTYAIGIAVLLIALGGGYVAFLSSGLGKFSITGTCITGETYHVHPELTIIINGERQEIPVSIGTFPCIRPIHTHDARGTIHLENAKPFTATLGDFFAVWGKSFSRHQILDSHADDAHEIAMTVNGQPSNEYENLTLEDKQQIVIEYRKK